MAQTAAERGQEVRQRLRQAAVELIGERGWRAVSTRQVAERAAVAPGLVHYHFASLDALLREAATGLMRGVVAEMDGVLHAGTGLAAGTALMLAALEPYAGGDAVSRVFLETYLAATRDPELNAEVTAIMAGFCERVAGWLAGCGVADPEPTAVVLAAAVDGLLLYRGLDPRVSAGFVGPVLNRITGGVPGGERTEE